MIGDILFYVPLIVSIGIGLVYFRDLGDVSQMVLRVKRKNMHRFIRNESRFLSIGLCSIALMSMGYFFFDGGSAWLFWTVLILVCVLFGFTWLYVHIGMRNQMYTAKYYSIEEAREYVNPSGSLVVLEKAGVARAHPDNQILRPHLAGDEEGINGENVVMTY